jgi:hypothetical protein
MQALDLFNAPGLELSVYYGEHLIENVDVGGELDRDGERQPGQHSAGEAFDRSVHVPLQLRERGDVFHPRLDCASWNPEGRREKRDVLAAGEFRVEAEADR